MACTEMGKQRTRRVSLSFRIAACDGDTSTVLSAANRFSVAFNPVLGALRLTVSAQGKFEFVDPALSKGAVRIARFPMPVSGLVFTRARIGVAPDSNAARGTILIDVPRDMLPSRATIHPMAMAPKPGPRDVTAAVMGDPPPGRSALDQRRRGDD